MNLRAIRKYAGQAALTDTDLVVNTSLTNFHQTVDWMTEMLGDKQQTETHDRIFPHKVLGERSDYENKELLVSLKAGTRHKRRLQLRYVPFTTILKNPYRMKGWLASLRTL